MPNKQHRFSAALLVFTMLFAVGTGRSYAGESVTFGPDEAKIEGSIKYTLIGRYIARFNRFKGRIIYDEKSRQVQSVFLAIDAGSVKSKHPLFDRLARSRKLLYAARYPFIIFKSDKIIRDESGYKVKGVLEMRGIERKLIFPFTVEVIEDQNDGRRWLVLQGGWNVNRKDFNIIWNKYLDRGGILVSDIFTVIWKITVLL